MTQAEFNQAIARLESEYPTLDRTEYRRHQDRARKHAHRDHKNAINRAYYWRSREKVLARVNAHNALVRAKNAAADKKRAQFKKNAVTPAQWTAIVSALKNTDKKGNRK